MKILLPLILLAASFKSYAWDYSENVKIDAFFLWETGMVPNAMVVLSNGKMCHVPTSDEQLFAFVLALYMAHKPVGIHCYDELENVGGYSSKRIHRIGATQPQP